MLNYQVENSRQTLADGVAEYYAAYAEQVKVRELNPEAKEFFRCHDVAHVVFGCDISLRDEMVVKLSSMFGTSAGLGVLKGYRLAESKEVYAELRLRDVLATAAASIVLVPRTLVRCLRMPKRWHWDAFDQYLDSPLAQIREEFGVVVSS